MQHDELQEWHAFVRSEAHVLARFPELVWQQAANQPTGSAVAARVVALQAAGRWTRRPWLRLVNREAASEACLLDLRFEGDPTNLAIADEGARILVVEFASWIAPNAGGFSIWDADTGRNMFRLPVPGGVSSSAILPGGRRVICVKERSARIRDLDGGESTYSFEYPEPYRLSAIAASPDGRLVAGGGVHFSDTPAPVLVWNASTGACVHKLEGHEQEISALVFTPDGQQLVSGSSDGGVRVWDARAGTLVRDLGRSDCRVNDLAVTCDGRRLAACGRGRGAGLKIWDLESGVETPLPDRLHATVLAFTPDGARLIVGDDSGELVVFDGNSGQELGRLPGHKAYVRALAVTADGTRVVSCSDDRSVKVWDLSQARTSTSVEQMRNRGGVKAIRFNAQGDQLTCYGQHDRIIWDCRAAPPTGKKVHESSFAPGFFRPLEWRDTYQTPNGSRTVVLAPRTDYRAWKKGPIAVRDERTRELVSLLGTQEMNIWHGQMEITPDGARVIVLAGDKYLVPVQKALVQWHVDSGTVRDYFKFQGDVVSLQLTPDARGVFLAFGSGELTTFDLDTFALTQDLKHHTQVAAAVVTPDGRRIVSAGQDRSAFVWDIATGLPIARYIGGGDFGAVAASDRLIAVGDLAGDIVILELMGVDPAPRLVPLLQEENRTIWICPYCDARAPATSPAGSDVVCERCDRALRVVQVPPCRPRGPGEVAAMAIALKDIIREPPRPVPLTQPTLWAWLGKLVARWLGRQRAH